MKTVELHEFRITDPCYAGQRAFPGMLEVLQRNRDSDVLAESNWFSALKSLGGEGEDVQIYRFNHWGCGWYEVLTVRKGSGKEAVALEIVESIESYPILDESDFSDREQEAAQQIWKDCYNVADRIRYIRDYRNQFEFHDFADLLNNVRGNYFSGYASELIG